MGQLCFITNLCALDSGFSSLSLPGLCSRDVVEPDAVFIKLALQTANHCSYCVFVRGEAQFVPAAKEGS